MKNFHRKEVCDQCPFRKEGGVGHLGAKRAKEIIDQNKTEGFVCHKTVDYDKEQGEIDPQRRQCAGAMILAQKTKSGQPYIQLHLALLGKLKLSGQELVVDTEEEFIKKQSC